jgi:hypothetical protein
MLDLTRTRIEKSRELSLLSTTNITAEGVCMQMVLEGGFAKCMPSNATANSQFAGFSWGTRFLAPTVSTNIEVVTADSNGNLPLSYTSISAASMSVFPGDSYGGSALSNLSSGTPNGTQWVLETNGNGVQLAESNAGDTFMVVYAYNPTMAQLQDLYGDALPGMTVNAAIQQVGLINGGYVFTDQFDPTVNWAAAISDSPSTQICGGANGMVTIGNDVGCQLFPHVTLSEVPTAGSAFLGLYLRG